MPRPKRGRSPGADTLPKRARSPGADPLPPRALPPRAPPPPPPRALPLELLGDDAAPLRLILVGNNPSVATAAAGIPYAHGSNRFWHLLSAHVAPTAAVPPTPASAAALPLATGVGLLDVGAGVVGTHLAAFTSSHFAAWAPRFYARLAAHAAAAAAAVGCTCGACGAPAIVATTGKRQWQELLVAGSGARALPRVEFGRQPDARPAGWPLPPSTQVWVLTSTSGAAALTNEARAAPWRELGAALQRVAWPRRAACRDG